MKYTLSTHYFYILLRTPYFKYLVLIIQQKCVEFLHDSLICTEICAEMRGVSTVHRTVRCPYLLRFLLLLRLLLQYFKEIIFLIPPPIPPPPSPSSAVLYFSYLLRFLLLLRLLLQSFISHTSSAFSSSFAFFCSPLFLIPPPLSPPPSPSSAIL
jgi:hypothetical protein